jgi:polyhydroxyalkanoate synthase
MMGGLSWNYYLLNARTLMGLADAVEAMPRPGPHPLCREQWMAAAAPSNFLAFNAEAQKKAIDTKGESIAKGMQNLLHDMRQGHVSMTDESVFEVGKNVATTEGAVVFENELFQLIEYKPLTAKVYERPFLLVPPCINKFYILDLQPENSLIRYAVEQGHRTFVVSWRNPDESPGPPRPGTTTSSTPPSRPSRRCRRSPAPRPSTRWASAWAAPSWAPRWPCWPRAAKSRWPAPRF